jgi:hypothetical protein
MRYKSETGRDGIDRHVKIIKQIMVRGTRVDGETKKKLEADFVNMQHAIYGTEQPKK